MKTRRNGVKPGPSSSRRSKPGETSTGAQLRTALQALEENVSQTTDDFRAMGIYQVSARIHALRQQGNDIVTELFDGYSSDGYYHRRMARYTLIGVKSPARSRDGKTGRTKGGA